MYDNSGHDVNNGYVCVMERFDEDNANEFYSNIADNKTTPFCASCLSAMQELVPKKLHHGN